MISAQVTMLALSLVAQRTTETGSPDVIRWVLLGILAIVLLVIGIAVIAYFGLWLQAYMAGAKISLFQIIAMRLRKVNPGVIVRARIMGVQADVPLDTRPLEAHYLAGGNVMNIVRALIAADRADLGLDL